MTRINTIAVELLLDQHLMAEYRELPMVLASLRRSLRATNGQPQNLKIPPRYTLNAGHVSFFYNKETWLFARWRLLIKELKYRGYRINHSARDLDWSVFDTVEHVDWSPTMADKLLNFERIVQRLDARPNWYKFHGVSVDPRQYVNRVLRVLSK